MADNSIILEEIIKACRQSIEPIKKEEIKELQELLKELNTRVTNENDPWSGNSEKSREYWANAGLTNSYKITGHYNELLHIITKILDILRGQSLDILIQKNQRDSNGNIIDISIFQGKESNLITEPKYYNVQYDLEKSKENLDKIQKGNKAFIRHYSNFYNIAQEHIKSTRSGGKWKKKINEGNIVEAFQRHMKMNHMDEDIENATFSDPIKVRDVIISLYYSVGNTPWWQQGDIGYLQVKSNNLKLASQVSIRRVASKIKDMFNDLENFNIEEFNRIFTAQEQNEMTDYSKLSEAEQKNLINEIKNNPNFKNITIKLFD